MSSESAIEQIINGYQQARQGLDDLSLQDWILFTEDTENGGALAAITFYGACIRECMSRDVDSPLQAHMVALMILKSFEEDSLGDIFNYLVGQPLPSRVGDFIEYWKTDLRPQISNALMTADGKPNFQVSFEVVEDEDDWEDEDLDDWGSDDDED